MKLRALLVYGLLVMSALLFILQPASASEWHSIALGARPLNITANRDAIWACGADELIANSTDGGKTWNVQHVVKGGAVLLAIGVAGEGFVYAAGTGGALLFTKDGGKTWTRMIVPASVVYAASFSDDRHGLIQTPHTIYRTSDGGTSWEPVKIDLSSDALKGFPYVRTLVALDANHMTIVMSQGNAAYYADKLLVTKDGGTTWKPIDIPSTGLTSLSAFNDEYWAAGVEVIEKDKPGGGYGVPVVLHSADGESWHHLIKWAPKEFSACNSQTCLFGDNAGVDFRAASPQGYWMFPSEKAVTARWAVAHDGICSIAVDLKCAALTLTSAMPANASDSPIPTLLSPPPLDAPSTQAVQCIACDVEKVIVTEDYQGIAEVELRIKIALNGLVDEVEVTHATKPAIGDRIASQVRNWIFVPYEKDGVVHPAVTNVKLRVQAIKSK
ncbi:MAG: YCF48-related protein [Candidatus Acidiferrales bacterium]